MLLATTSHCPVVVFFQSAWQPFVVKHTWTKVVTASVVDPARRVSGLILPDGKCLGAVRGDDHIGYLVLSRDGEVQWRPLTCRP
jgi:hypothetical protein